MSNRSAYALSMRPISMFSIASLSFPLHPIPHASPASYGSDAHHVPGVPRCTARGCERSGEDRALALLHTGRLSRLRSTPYAGQDMCHNAVVLSLPAMAERALDQGRPAVIFLLLCGRLSRL